MKKLINFKILMLTVCIMLFSNSYIAQTAETKPIAESKARQIFFDRMATLQKQGFDTNADKTRKEIKALDKLCVKLDITVYIDNQLKESEDYLVTITNISINYHPVPLSSHNKFVVYLNFDQEYEIEITHKGCDSKKIYVNTNAPYDNWYLVTQFRLKKGSRGTINAGSIKYNDKKQTFESIRT